MVLLIALGACGRHIGDDCTTNVQCNAQGTQECDVSQPGGYCTIEGCDVSSCPDESLCVRFFPASAQDGVCTYPDTSKECPVRDICLSEGICIEPRFERRFCMKSCSSKGDCRDGYDCCPTDVGGAELLPRSNGVVPKARFCAFRCAAPGTGMPDAGTGADGPPPDAPPDAGADAPPDGAGTDTLP